MGNSTDEFNPEERHLELDTDESGNVICTRCKKVLEERTTALSVTDMVFGQYRYIRENLPCKTDAESELLQR